MYFGFPSLRSIANSRFLSSFIISTLLILFCHNVLAQNMTDGFNFPVGPRNPGIVTAPSDADGWYNVQGFQVYNSDSAASGYHSGEDWNDECGGANDVGAPVYAVANGEVVGFREVIGATSGESIGDVLVLKHTLGTGEIYSLYLHINVGDNIVPGADVERDQQIGEIADISSSGLSPHLHFEMRTKPVDLRGPPEGELWPSDDDGKSNNSYYSASEAETLETIMEKDGLIDPSAFLSINRPSPSSLERGRIPSTFTFQRDLNNGTCRHEVRYLQIFLNHDAETSVAGADEYGSLGNEVSEFGSATENAVERFQEKYLGWDETSLVWGVVNDETRNELNSILSDSKAYPNVDVALIIDSSGSMTWNDPDDARLDAARAYLTGSFSGDFVGVVDFDDSARLASELLELPDSKDNLIDAIETIDSSGGTNIGIGIQEGCDALLASPSLHNFTKGAILLTDGEGGSSEQKECFEKRRWPIYTFGLGSAVNDMELETIALETGGEYTQLPANSFICEFQRVRAKIAGAEPPPCTSFVIFQSEFTTFYVEVEPGQLQITFSVEWLGSDIITTLITPSGRVIDMNTVASDVTHDKGATFEVFTITNPEAGEWEVELFGADIPEGGEEATFGFVSVPSPVTVVRIDIKPDSDSNPVNLKSNGIIPVAILTTSTADGNFMEFDALEVDPLTVSFGAGGAVEARSYGHAEDVDGDGDIDLVLHFSILDTGVMCGDTNMTLTGETFGGQVIEGVDSVSVINCQ